MPSHTHLARESHVISQATATRDAYLGDNQTMFANHDVVGDLDKIVDFGAMLQARRAVKISPQTLRYQNTSNEEALGSLSNKFPGNSSPETQQITTLVACLFHDVGKPPAQVTKHSEERGEYRMYAGHEQLSARIWVDYAMTHEAQAPIFAS
jgi:hypothetical protein